tara:strand:- start:1190 stop:2071 length:882 start_codon:yes stop_codon:yes gene_type:complete
VENFLNNKNYEFIFKDIRNFKNIDNLFNNVTDIIILAGLVGDPITKKYPKISKEINYLALKDFIDNCNGRGINKVVFISTCSNYGLIKNETLANEDYVLNPMSDYARHKIDIEKYIMSLKGKVDYSPTILRFATAFGISPRMRFDLTINEFTRELYLKNNLDIYDANTWRPYCHVNDFVKLIDKVLQSPKDKTNFQIFNAGGDENNSTKLKIIQLLKKYFPKSNVYFKDKGSDPRNYRVDFSKVKKVLNFKPEHSIEDGIKEIVNALDKGKFKKLNEYNDNLGNYKIHNEQTI